MKNFTQMMKQAQELQDTAENQCPLSEHQQRQIRALIREADALSRDT